MEKKSFSDDSKNMAGSRIGIFGGTFNPIHKLHLDVAREVLEKANLDKILFIPAANSPWRFEEKDMASARDRFAMVSLAVRGEESFLASDVESGRDGLSYTFDTVQLLRGLYPETRFYLVLGMDAMLGIRLWHRGEELLSLIPFLVLTRPGAKEEDLLSLLPEYERKGDFLFCPGRPEVRIIRVKPSTLSATEIRQRIRKNLDVSGMLPEIVRDYIEKRGLYVCTS